MHEKEKLNVLLDIIGDLLKEEGNEWLVDGLLQKISETSPLEDIAKHSIIQNIHEYCIEQKVDKQANDFYCDFKVKSIQSQLIDDYKRMEHDRRRDDFENFCLRVYQQIECITNYLFDNFIITSWDSQKNKIAVKSQWDAESMKYVKPKNDGVTLESLVFGTAKQKKWHANRKFSAVLFYFYFNKNIVKDSFEFNSIYYTQDEIYQMRNENHRGGIKNDYQKKTLQKIVGNESKYYFKFYGFLQDFVVKVNRHIQAPKEHTEKKSGQSKKQNSRKETLGDNPEMKELFQSIAKNFKKDE